MNSLQRRKQKRSAKRGAKKYLAEYVGECMKKLTRQNFGTPMLDAMRELDRQRREKESVVP